MPYPAGAASIQGLATGQAMTVFQWIVDEDGPTTPYSDLVAVDDLLDEIHYMMQWENETPGGPHVSPTFEQLEAGVKYALGELSKAERRYNERLKIVDSESPIGDDPHPVILLIDHMDATSEEDLLRDYPEDLPKNQVFVFGCVALYFIDRAVGCLLEGESTQAVNAMAQATSAIHAAGFYNGEDYGAKNFRLANSSKGGEARNAKYRQLQKWSIDRYRERKWNSAHQASHELKDDVLAHAKNIGVSLSQYRAQQTIYSWFLGADKTTIEEDEKSSSAGQS
nr:hypothetical protein [Burkholderia gladioli]